MQLTQTIIRLPEIALKTRDAHKLRGFFGELFKEHTPLLHNHYDDGEVRYGYPPMQYKVIDRVSVLTGFGEGSRLLIELFLKIKELDIEGVRYIIYSKNIENRLYEIDDFSQLNEYEFTTLWMALNQKNFTIFMNLKAETEKKLFLQSLYKLRKIKGCCLMAEPLSFVAFLFPSPIIPVALSNSTLSLRQKASFSKI